jgi:hypothetical protein
VAAFASPEETNLSQEWCARKIFALIAGQLCGKAFKNIRNISNFGIIHIRLTSFLLTYKPFLHLGVELSGSKWIEMAISGS